MDASVTLALVLVVTSVLTVVGALLAAAGVERALAARRVRRETSAAAPGAAVFLLSGGEIADANGAGRALLATLREQGGDGDDWAALSRHLAARFPAAMADIALPGPQGWDGAARDGSGLRLRVQPVEGAVRLTLTDGAADGDGVVPVDRLSWHALSDELELLRRTTDSLPAPAWRETEDGQIIWANGAYLRLLADANLATAMNWPLPALFPDAGSDRAVRQGVTLPGGRMRWFDLVVQTEGWMRLVCALPADAAHKADRARRDFVQTLSRTFATLTIGLAVFDRTRRLQVFNPALTDLTGLEPEFLSSRPGVEGFLNRLRDKHVLPEPRDYRAWSRRLLEVEAAAQIGSGFQETWALADGRSFRVSAAPHPDGALAFLIEDVTSDTRLKRSFRTELDTLRSALDLTQDAVAVFAPGGELVLTNAAFDRTWTLDGADTLAGVRLRDALANWRATGPSAALWDNVAALATPGAEPEVRGTVDLGEGERMTLHARQGPGGAVILAFSACQDSPRPDALPAGSGRMPERLERPRARA